MEENTIHIHNGTTLAHSHQFGKFEEDFIRHIEDAKEKMRQANKQWSEVFGPLLSNIPNGVGKKQICSFCQFSSSTYDRLRKRLPSVKSGIDDLYVWCVGLGELLHRELVHVGGHGDLLITLITELNILAEHIDDVADHKLLSSENGMNSLT